MSDLLSSDAFWICYGLVGACLLYVLSFERAPRGRQWVTVIALSALWPFFLVAFLVARLL